MERVVPFLADTSGPFEQLLDAEQTAQSVQAWIQKKENAIRTIKKQAIDQDIPRNDVYGHIKQLEQDIGRFKQLLKSIEASRNNWRKLHMAAWRATIRPLMVVDLPNEVLATIFANFEDVPVPKIQVDTSESDYFPPDGDLPSPDVASIKNIRLTCRAFCEVGSRFLLPVVDIVFTRSSLQRLEEISKHSLISKSVRVIRIHTDAYNPRSAEDWVQFCDTVVAKLRLLPLRFEVRAMRGQQEAARDCRLVGLNLQPGLLNIRELEEVLQDAQDLMEIVNRISVRGPHSVASLDPFEAKISKAIAQAHDEYRQKYQEQNSLAYDHRTNAIISKALCQMPSVKRLCIIKSCRRRIEESLNRWDQPLDTQKWKTVLRSSNPFRKMVTHTGFFGGHTLLNWNGDPPFSLVLKLPLVLQAGNGNLTHLDISFPPVDNCHMGIVTEYLQDLRHACQQLKSVRIQVSQSCRSWGVPTSLAMTYSLLEAMLASPGLEVVKLYLTSQNKYNLVDCEISIGPLLARLPWSELRTVCFAYFPIKVEELRRVLAEAPRKIDLDLTGIYLLEGTWSEALEILRGKADSASQIVNPRGVEIDAMSKREAQCFRAEFDSESRDGWYSVQRCPGPVSFYIRGGNIPNPLIWGSD